MRGAGVRRTIFARARGLSGAALAIIVALVLLVASMAIWTGTGVAPGARAQVTTATTASPDPAATPASGTPVPAEISGEPAANAHSGEGGQAEASGDETAAIDASGSGKGKKRETGKGKGAARAPRARAAGPPESPQQWQRRRFGSGRRAARLRDAGDAPPPPHRSLPTGRLRCHRRLPRPERDDQRPAARDGRAGARGSRSVPAIRARSCCRRRCRVSPPEAMPPGRSISTRR